jgi:hypothetical protein
MAVTTRANTKELPQLNSNHKENMFSVKRDDDGTIYYDLTDDIHIDPVNLEPTDYIVHEITENENFYSISYDYYNTTNLWWVVPILNNIENPFKLKVGEKIKLPNGSLLDNILNAVNG